MDKRFGNLNLIKNEQQLNFKVHGSKQFVQVLPFKDTERKLAEEASILEERNRMAREIHDTLAQAFTGIAIHLGGALRVVENAEAVKDHITIARELSRTGLAEARASVQALRSPFLTNNDLCSALNQVATQISLTSDAEIIYQVKGTPYILPFEIESNLLRIGQEALSNATKHTNASA